MSPAAWNSFYAGDYDQAYEEMRSANPEQVDPSIFCRTAFFVLGPSEARSLVASKYDLDGEFSYLRLLFTDGEDETSLVDIARAARRSADIYYRISAAVYYLRNNQANNALNVLHDLDASAHYEIYLLRATAFIMLRCTQQSQDVLDEIQRNAFDDIVALITRATINLSLGCAEDVIDELMEWWRRRKMGITLLCLAAAAQIAIPGEQGPVALELLHSGLMANPVEQALSIERVTTELLLKFLPPQLVCHLLATLQKTPLSEDRIKTLVDGVCYNKDYSAQIEHLSLQDSASSAQFEPVFQTAQIDTLVSNINCPGLTAPVIKQLFVVAQRTGTTADQLTLLVNLLQRRPTEHGQSLSPHIAELVQNLLTLALKAHDTRTLLILIVSLKNVITSGGLEHLIRAIDGIIETGQYSLLQIQYDLTTRLECV